MIIFIDFHLSLSHINNMWNKVTSLTTPSTIICTDLLQIPSQAITQLRHHAHRPIEELKIFFLKPWLSINPFLSFLYLTSAHFYYSHFLIIFVFFSWTLINMPYWIIKLSGFEVSTKIWTRILNFLIFPQHYHDNKLSV